MSNSLNKKYKIIMRGFTLIELLIVIAIITILAVVAIPQYFKYKREAAVSTATDILRICINELATQYSENSAVKSKDCIIPEASKVCKVSVSENSGLFFIKTSNCTFNLKGYSITCTIDSHNRVHCE